MKWPVVYLQISKEEELMSIREDEWTHDVDTRSAIGPIPKSEQDHFVIDSGGCVHSVTSEGNSPPSFTFKQTQSNEAIDALRRRASRWGGIEADKVADIIAELVRRDY